MKIFAINYFQHGQEAWTLIQAKDKKEAEEIFYSGSEFEGAKIHHVYVRV